MAALLYGQSIVTDIYGALCLKLLGCLVATLQDLYGVVNVDDWLSVSDIAFLMNKGGVLALTDDRRVFESQIFYVFTGANVQSKFRELMAANQCRSSFGVLTTRRVWTTYYKKLFDDQTKAAKAQRALRTALAQISVPSAFTRKARPSSKQHCQRILFACWHTASDNGCRKVIHHQQLWRKSPQQKWSGTDRAASAIGSQGSILVNLLPPVPALTAIYGTISAQRRDRYAGYVAPDTLAIDALQRIVGWNTIVDFIFDAAGDAYMRSLTLYRTQQRTPVIYDNFVFIYDPANHSLVVSFKRSAKRMSLF